MTDIEIIARAQMYLEKLANGIDPLTNKDVAENDVVNNVRISRCLHYVTGILKQITTTGSFEIQKSEFTLSARQLERFAYSQTPLTVSEITKRLNELADPLQYNTLKNGVITEWLTESGMLTNVVINNKSKKRVTNNGRNIGIISEQRVNQQGSTYEAISYNLNAQHFIIDNIHAVIELNRQKANKKNDGSIINY
ncbi:MAG: hypothetical protein U0L58_08825 [Ruminococcus sp.]|nr:hypothetical protein [Ruminococcus sp.]